MSRRQQSAGAEERKAARDRDQEAKDRKKKPHLMILFQLIFLFWRILGDQLHVPGLVRVAFGKWDDVIDLIARRSAAEAF